MSIISITNHGPDIVEIKVGDGAKTATSILPGKSFQTDECSTVMLYAVAGPSTAAAPEESVSGYRPATKSK